MGGRDDATASLIQDHPFHESGVCGTLQNSDPASKANKIRPPLAKLFLTAACSAAFLGSLLNFVVILTGNYP